MFGLGVTEILIIGVVGFAFFGAKRLPELGGSIAKGIRNFQKELKNKDDEKPQIPEKNDPPSDKE